MKFTRSAYQGSPCWRLTGRHVWADADWNTRWPFGVSACLRLGLYRETIHKPGCETDCRCPVALPRGPGFTLDLNAPLGEPNRLYLWLVRWQITIGLLTWHEFRETGRDGGVICGGDARCRPHLAGISRYRYHQDSNGKWVRNDKPEPLHWGWLTIERTRR